MCVAGFALGQSWTPLKHPFPDSGTGVPFVMTDGTIMVHDVDTNQWYKLTPDSSGNYIDGTWTTMPTMGYDYAPRDFASAVLKDGRLVLIGGEYNFGSPVFTNIGKIYDPVTNTWANLPSPSTPAPNLFTYIGDAVCAVFPDGRFMISNSAFSLVGGTPAAAILDPTTLTWTLANTSTKSEQSYDEEGWTLLKDGTLLTVDVVDSTTAEKYDTAADTWYPAGTLPASMSNSVVGYEMGPAVLMFDGNVFATGGTGATAIYTPPALKTDPGTWAAGPTPALRNSKQPVFMDCPACLLTNGKVLVAASPNWDTDPQGGVGTSFYEYDETTNSLTLVPDPPTAASSPCWPYMMLMLPNGQVMLTNYNFSEIDIYSSSGGPSDAWRPTIATAPPEVSPSTDYLISGTQFNGLSQTSAYGDDDSNATNYPLVRITNRATGHVRYCFTHDHSTMAVATGAAIVSTHFKVPAGIEVGDSDIEVVANGIPSAKQEIFVCAPTITSLAPDHVATGSGAFILTINGAGFQSGATIQWFDSSNTETDLPSSFISSSQITTTIPASLLTNPQACTVDVENSPSFISSASTFRIGDRPPVANAGSAQNIEATGPLTNFTLDGTGSGDPDGDSLTYTWFDSSNTQVGTGSTLSLSRAVGVFTFKLTVSDGTLSDDATVQITIKDTTPPAFPTLSDITVAAASNAGTVVTFGPFIANDLVDGSITGTAVPASGSTFPAGSTLVTVSATDAHSNTGTAKFHVNVLYSWSGFQSPLPKSQVKMGSTIPIKFQLTGASAPITNLVAAAYWNNGGANHLIGSFTYAASSHSYQLQFKTNGVPNGNINIVVQFGDGSLHTTSVVIK